MKRNFVILFAIFISACSANFDDAFEKTNEFSVQVYESGKTIREYKITRGSIKFSKLETWARNNEWGWNSTPATYAPGIVVVGGGFIINFVGDSVVINNSDGQYYKEIDPRDYAFLKMK